MKQKKKKKMMMMFFENVKHSECLSSLSLLARSLAGRDVDSMLERERDRGEPHLPLLRGILFTPGRGIQGE